MNVTLQNLELLVDAFNSLPGIGKKMATKLACHILECDKKMVDIFAARLKTAKEKIGKCKYCNNYTEFQLVCTICSDENRSKKKICIVTNYLDLVSIENCLSWTGIYYVLGKEITPNSKIDSNELDLSKLLKLLSNGGEEVLISTDLTPRGVLTADYLYQIIKKYQPDTKIFRIGFGMPVNSSINYADEMTLKYAFDNKQEYKK